VTVLSAAIARTASAPVVFTRPVSTWVELLSVQPIPAIPAIAHSAASQFVFARMDSLLLVLSPLVPAPGPPFAKIDTNCDLLESRGWRALWRRSADRQRDEQAGALRDVGHLLASG